MSKASKTSSRRRLTTHVVNVLNEHPTLRGKTVVDGSIRGGACGRTIVKLGRTRNCVVLEVVEYNAVQRVYVNGRDVVAAERAVRKQLQEYRIEFSGK